MSSEIRPDGLKPVGVFKAVYLLLLTFGLYGLGARLAAAQPAYVAAIVGEGNVMVAQGVYLFMLVTAGLFVFAAYLSFEAFEHRQGPYVAACMPTVIAWRVVEIVLRFSLVATLTVKLWQPEDDSALALYVTFVAFALLLWTLLVRSKYGADIAKSEVCGNAALAIFSLILLIFSHSQYLATYFALGAVLLLLILSLGLFIAGVVILTKVVKPFLHEVAEAKRKLFAQAGV